MEIIFNMENIGNSSMESIINRCVDTLIVPIENIELQKFITSSSSIGRVVELFSIVSILFKSDRAREEQLILLWNQLLNGLYELPFDIVDRDLEYIESWEVSLN